MVIPGVVLVSRVGINVVLHVHILELKVGPCICHSPTSVIPQCTTLLPSLWLPFILFLVLLSGVMHALSQTFYSKIIDHQGKVYLATVVLPWSGFFA